MIALLYEKQICKGARSLLDVLLNHNKLFNLKYIFIVYVRYAVLCYRLHHTLTNGIGVNVDGCMATRPINCVDRSIRGHERLEDATDRWSGHRWSSICPVKTNGWAAAAAFVDLSEGEKVKILYGRRHHSWPGAREFNSAGRRQMLRLTGPDSGSAGLETDLRSTVVSTHQFHYGHPPTTTPRHRHRTGPVLPI